MDTPESPTQSPQSPDEEEKGFSDSELLESPESPAEDGNGVSDSELLNDGEEGDADSDFDDDEQVELIGGAQEDISDLEDDRMDRGGRVHLQESALLECRQRMSRSAEPEGEEEILETPRSPDPDSPEPELDRPFTPADGEQEYVRQEDEDDGAEVTARSSLCGQDLDEEDDDEEERRQRRLMVVSDLKQDSPSVSRDLDEHELDYDEEVPEEPSTAAPEEEDTEKGPATEDGDEDEEEKDEEDKKRKKERKLILPPDAQCKKSEVPRGQEGGRRESFRDKKKDEDDGEIDEGEIDVSALTLY